MAIYQFYLAVIPKNGLLKKYKELPINIGVSTETGYFESNTEEFWKLAEINSIEIIQEIDKLVKRVDWKNDKFNINWKTYTNEIDNDVWMSTNKSTGEIEELSFRADLREKKLDFLKNMIELGKKYDWLFMDRKGKLANPNFHEIAVQIKNSNAFKFLTKPYDYLASLNSQDKENE